MASRRLKEGDRVTVSDECMEGFSEHYKIDKVYKVVKVDSRLVVWAETNGYLSSVDLYFKLYSVVQIGGE